MQNQNPSGHESDEKPKQNLFNWVKNHKVTAALIGIFVFSLGDVMNYFGNNPRMLYFPAVAACVLICWIVLSGTHKFIMSQSSTPSFTNNSAAKPVETINNLTTIPPTVSDSITTPSPSAIMAEINAVRPMQQNAIANSFIGAKVRWLLYFRSVDNSGFGFIAIFTNVKDAKTFSELLQSDFRVVILCKGISDEDKNLLRLAEKDSPFYVSGTISDCSHDVILTNCNLETYIANTSIK